MAEPATILFLLKRIDCNDGVSSYLETLLTGLKARGDKAVLISGRVTAPPETLARRARMEAAVEEWLVLEDLSPRRLDVRNLQRVRQVMARHKVDVISPQGLTMLPFSFVLSKLTGKRVVTNYHPSVHGTDPTSIPKGRSLKKRLGYRAVAALFTPWRFIALSKDIVRFFQQECGVAPGRIAYIVAGIDSDRYRPPGAEQRQAARAAFELPEQALALVLTGRLNFNKGHDLVIEAVRKLRRSHPALRIICLFPGTGADAEAIKARALQEPADAQSFRFLGFVDDDTLLNVYWAADVALLPSRLEGFGLAVAEAMSCGAVPIRTPSGGAEDQIIEGETGFIVPFNDAEALAARILDLADAPRRAKMREATIAHALEHFTKETMVARTSALYHAAAGRK